MCAKYTPATERTAAARYGLRRAFDDAAELADPLTAEPHLDPLVATTIAVDYMRRLPIAEAVELGILTPPYVTAPGVGGELATWRRVAEDAEVGRREAVVRAVRHEGMSPGAAARYAGVTRQTVDSWMAW